MYAGTPKPECFFGLSLKVAGVRLLETLCRQRDRSADVRGFIDKSDKSAGSCALYTAGRPADLHSSANKELQSIMSSETSCLAREER